MWFLAADDSKADGGINPLGHVLDVTLIEGPGGMPLLTLHMVTLIAAFGLLLLFMNMAAKSIATGSESEGNDRYRAKGRVGQFVEVIVIYMRDNVIEPVLGDNTRRFLPYLLTLFFFVLMNNLLGLVPLLDLQHLFGALIDSGREETLAMGNVKVDSHFALIGGTATGNLAVTGALALIAFIVINVHGIRENGIGGWCHHLLGGAPGWLFFIMIPVELMSMFIKPGALAVRLFANMLAGHTLMATLALFGVMAWKGTDSLFAGSSISVVSGVFAVAITFLELFVAFLQAFIFMFLTAVFLGQMNHHGHHDHDEHHAHEGSVAEAA
ncbi:MAG: F0F1 ATP synthase subunit A [Planctomycetota bacterium]